MELACNVPMVAFMYSMSMCSHYSRSELDFPANGKVNSGVDECELYIEKT